MRTTLDIEGPILLEAKALARRRGQSLGQTVSELLAVALRAAGGAKDAPKPVWVSHPMGARVDLADREAVYGAMDEEFESAKVAEGP